MPAQKLTKEMAAAAIQGFEEQKREINAQIAELRAMLSGGSAGPIATPEPSRRRRRKVSAAGRKAMAEAQRKRWAAVKGTSKSAMPAAAKPKRKLSAAGKAAIVAALKKRWAAKKAEAAKK